MALTDSLVSYWKMDEASGDALDAHGSNTLTDTNTVTAGTGKINNARDFEDANSEYFTHVDNAGLSTGDIDWTFTAWVNAESLPSNNKRIICKLNNAQTLLDYDLYYNGGSGAVFRFDVYGSSSITSASWSSGPSTGTWYFIVAWHDSVNDLVGIQVNNGTPVTASTVGAGAPNDTAAPFSIGSLDGLATTFWDGLIDEVGFWKRLLTTQEKTDLYNSGNGLAYGTFSGGITLDEGGEWIVPVQIW